MSKRNNQKIIKDMKQKQKEDTIALHNSTYKNKDVRSILKIIKSKTTQDGEGVTLNRSFPNSYITDFDPFLLLDEIGPIDIRPGDQKGFPDHPHRGFETVTYLLEGKFEHKDSQGHSGTISAGDVQWMTAGSGVIHSEMPEKEFSKNGGKLHGFQLWINLPKKNKMIKPRYQEISSSKIPNGTTKNGNVSVKVIAGESLGEKAVIDTITPIMYLHFKLEHGNRIIQQVPEEYNVFAYVIKGKGLFEQNNSSNKIIERGNLVIFDKDGEEVYIQAAKESKDPLELLLIGGIPLNEPISRYGPFVMNTQQEIYQAIEDYRNGRLG
ncbi:MAG: pirin family protein [Nitrososphaeraceae archaeon]|nr:pirin family protein [Nitrososphaeraceae archaeon]